MTGYTKLSSGLINSTVWRESATTRVVWITLLALADKHGEVEASIPGLADAARVTIPECEAALATFLAPDKYSRTKDFDGRRIEEIDGGWVILNHAKYRHQYSDEERRDHTAKRVQRFRERQKALQVTQGNAGNGKQKQKAKAESKKDVPPSSADAEAVRVTWITPAQQAWDDVFGLGAFPCKQGATALAPLYKKGAGLTPAEIGKRMAAYLSDMVGRGKTDFVSPHGFAKVHGQYANGAPVTGADAEFARLAAEAADIGGYVA